MPHTKEQKALIRSLRLRIVLPLKARHKDDHNVRDFEDHEEGDSIEHWAWKFQEARLDLKRELRKLIRTEFEKGHGLHYGPSNIRGCPGIYSLTLPKHRVAKTDDDFQAVARQAAKHGFTWELTDLKICEIVGTQDIGWATFHGTDPASGRPIILRLNNYSGLDFEHFKKYPKEKWIEAAHNQAAGRPYRKERKESGFGDFW